MLHNVAPFVQEYINTITHYMGIVWTTGSYTKWWAGHQRRSLDLQTLPYLQHELSMLYKGRQPVVGRRMLNNGGLLTARL